MLAVTAVPAGTAKPNVLPGADLRLQPDPAAEERDETAAQGQTETRALLLRRSASPLLERLEDALAVLGRDARAVVAHGDLDVPPDPARADRDVATVGRELHRVAQQVHEHLLELQLVGLDHVERGIDVERDRDAVDASRAPGPSRWP